jgi:predicted phosphoribosyltransferase
MFASRTDAGHRLADLLDDGDIRADVVVAIPRGGLPVGRVVADRLGIPLGVVVARKVGAPGNPELAVGAVAADGTVWRNEPLIADLGIEEASLAERIAVQRRAAAEATRGYLGGERPPEYEGKTVLVVDDGVATGATTIACVRGVRAAGAARVVLAVPVGPPATIERLRGEADEVVCVETPPHFRAVGQFYASFDQVSDEEAKAYLRGDGARDG